jgi:hypothetical protein
MLSQPITTAVPNGHNNNSSCHAARTHSEHCHHCLLREPLLQLPSQGRYSTINQQLL